MKNQMQRRRVIKMLAAGSLSCALPVNALSAVLAKESSFHEWHGFALGAEISLQLYHHDPCEARRIIEGSLKIIQDMETLFSLYRQDSVISQLNKKGFVKNPPADFINLMRQSRTISQLTSGAFDISVQPLWKFYSDFYRQGNSVHSSPSPSEIRAVQKLVDYQKIAISNHQIAFAQDGMAVTLNGIAQGFATDKVSDYLKNQGMTSVLVDIGEYRALGPMAGGASWKIGLADPLRFGKLSEILDLTEGAVATSSGCGDAFDETGQYHHLIDPKNGKSPNHYLSVTVTAPQATLADALSTAFYSMAFEDIQSSLRQLSSVEVRLTDSKGTVNLL